MAESKPVFPTSLLSRLRFPWLFVGLLALLAVDLVIPDPLPLVDELVLTLLTLLAASWKNDAGRVVKPPEKNVTPPR